MASLLQITTSSGTLDLLQGTDASFYITRQVNDLTNLETREADFTRQITLPATANNYSILFDEAALAASVNVQTNTVQCSILLDGITVAPVAFLLFNSSEVTQKVTTLKVTLLYGNFSLFNSIKPGTIDSLNWADLDVLWNPVNVAALTNNEVDMVFPRLDWSGDFYYLSSSLTDHDIDHEGFFIYSKEILIRIIAEAGFTLQVISAPANYDILALACPITKFLIPAINDGVSLRSEVGLNANFVHAVDGTVLVPFDRIIVDVAGIWFPPEFVFSEANQITAAISGTVNWNEGHINNADPEIRIVHNGAIVDTLAFAGAGTNLAFFMSVEIAVANTDTVAIELFIDDTNPGNPFITLQADTLFSVATPDNIDQVVHPSEHIPQINKKEFLTAILTQFNLLMVTDSITKTVFLYDFDALYISEEQDWSTRLDVQKQVETFNAVEGYAQDSHLKYNADDLLLRRDLDYIKQFDNQIIALENTIIQQPYTFCDNSILSADLDTFIKSKMPFFLTETEWVNETAVITIQGDGRTFVINSEASALDFSVGDYFTITPSQSGVYGNTGVRIEQKLSELSGVVVPIDPDLTVGTFNYYQIFRFDVNQVQPRMCLMKTVLTAEGFFNISKGTTSADISSVPVQFPYKDAVTDSTVFWSDIAENTHYKNLLNALEAPQRIKAWFNFTVPEFESISFVRPVYISHFNAFYYINKIEQYKVNQKVRVDLIRISVLTE